MVKSGGSAFKGTSRGPIKYEALRPCLATPLLDTWTLSITCQTPYLTFFKEINCNAIISIVTFGTYQIALTASFSTQLMKHLSILWKSSLYYCESEKNVWFLNMHSRKCIALRHSFCKKHFHLSASLSHMHTSLSHIRKSFFAYTQMLILLVFHCALNFRVVYMLWAYCTR